MTVEEISCDVVEKDYGRLGSNNRDFTENKEEIPIFSL